MHQTSENNDTRNSDAGFIIHVLGYLFGTRLQFHDWWFDGRVPIKSTHNITITDAVIEDFISKSYRTWLAWTDQIKKWFLNILIMHSRVPTYEWEWERFMIEYMVFDGAYRITQELFQFRNGGHKQRFEEIFSRFGLEYHEDKIKEIYRLRNDLLHQSLWDQSQACTQRPGSKALYHQITLSNINNRVIPALLGYNTSYIGTPWWTTGSKRFDAEK